MNNNKPFIIFEGIDGSGKDTMLYMLLQAIKSNKTTLGNKRSHVWLTGEPTLDSNAGKILNDRLQGQGITKEEGLELYVQDRHEHTVLINQQLQHSIVLCSRYDLSTFIYQHAQGMPLSNIYEQHDYKNNKTIIPNYSFIINVDPKLAMERSSQRNMDQTYFENLDFLTLASNAIPAVVEFWQKLDRKIYLIDGNGTPEQVFEQILEIIT